MPASNLVHVVATRGLTSATLAAAVFLAYLLSSNVTTLDFSINSSSSKPTALPFSSTHTAASDATSGATVKPEKENCIDFDSVECKGWASLGVCSANPKYFATNYPEACGLCAQSTDSYHFGINQALKGDTHKWSQIVQALYIATQYKQNLTKEARVDCVYRHKLCGYWAAAGKCEANPFYMNAYCAPVCGTCELFEEANWLHVQRFFCPEQLPSVAPESLAETCKRLIAEPQIVGGRHPTHVFFSNIDREKFPVYSEPSVNASWSEVPHSVQILTTRTDLLFQPL